MILLMPDKPSLSDWITAISTAVSAIAIVATAIWAAKSYWITDKKDKVDRAMDCIKQLRDLLIVGEMEQLVNTLEPSLDNEAFKQWSEIKKSGDLEKEKEFDKKMMADLSPKVTKILTLFELVGLLLKYKKIDLPFIYDGFNLVINNEKFWSSIKQFIDEYQKKESAAWKHVVYLKEALNNYKSKEI